MQAADAVIRTTSLCTLVAGVSFISPDARAEIVKTIGDDPVGHFNAIASRGVDFAHMLSSMLPDYRGDNFPIVGFGIVALVLTVMMIRS